MKLSSKQNYQEGSQGDATQKTAPPAADNSIENRRAPKKRDESDGGQPSEPAEKQNSNGSGEPGEQGTDRKQQSRGTIGEEAQRKGGRGKSQVVIKSSTQQQQDGTHEDEVAIDQQMQKRSKRKASHQMKPNESSDLDELKTVNSINKNNASRQPHTQETEEQASSHHNHNQLFQKVQQRMGIVQRQQVAGHHPQNVSYLRGKSSNQMSNTAGAAETAEISRLSSP